SDARAAATHARAAGARHDVLVAAISGRVGRIAAPDTSGAPDHPRATVSGASGHSSAARCDLTHGATAAGPVIQTAVRGRRGAPHRVGLRSGSTSWAAPFVNATTSPRRHRFRHPLPPFGAGKNGRYLLRGRVWKDRLECAIRSATARG